MKEKLLIADSQGKIIQVISAIRKSDIQHKEILINRLEKVLDNQDKLSVAFEKLIEIILSCHDLLTKSKKVQEDAKQVIEKLIKKGIKKL